MPKRLKAVKENREQSTVKPLNIITMANNEKAMDKNEVTFEAYSPAVMPKSITTIEALKFWFLSYIKTMLVAEGVESTLVVLNESKTSTSRQSIKQTITSNLRLFCKAFNFEREANKQELLAIGEFYAEVANGKYNLQDILRTRVTSEKNDETGVITYSLDVRKPKAIEKAITNINTQLVKKATSLLQLSGNDANGKTWNTLRFSNEEIFSMFQTEANNNLTARKTVKVVKRSELEAENAELREQLKAFTAKA